MLEEYPIFPGSPSLSLTVLDIGGCNGGHAYNRIHGGADLMGHPGKKF